MKRTTTENFLTSWMTIGLFLLTSTAQAAGVTVTSTPGSTTVTATAATAPTGTATTRATGTTAAATTKGGKLEFDSVCSDVIGMEPDLKKAGESVNTQATQKLEWCKAAQDSKKAAGSNSTLAKVWGAVAGVCVTACVMSFMPGGGATMQTVCSGAQIGGGVTDAVVTKNFMSGLTGIGAGAAGLLAKGKLGKTGGKLLACASAATATMTTLQKNSASKSAKETMQENLALANDIGPVTNPFGALKMGAQGGNVNNVTVNQNTGTRGGQGLLGGGDSSAKPIKLNPGNCGSVSDGSSAAAIGCAIASDSNLPPFVGTPEFDAELQQRTGLGLNDFVAKVDDPVGSISSAAGANLPAEQAAQFGELMAMTAADVGAESTYAAGGGAPAPSAPAGDDGAAIASVAAKFMQKLQGGAAAEGEGGGGDSSKIGFNKGEPKLPGHLRGPASEDDVNVSLFDRVTYRYWFVGQRIYPQ